MDFLYLDLSDESERRYYGRRQPGILADTIKNRNAGVYDYFGSRSCLRALAMVLCPGIRSRVDDTDETFTGLAKLLSRFYKITVSIEELFGEVLILLLIAIVILVLQKKWKSWKAVVSNESVIFGLVALASSYALIVIPPPTPRAYYGVGVFLFIACIQAIRDCDQKEFTVALLRYGLAAVLCLWLMFTYFDNMINLWRINRENNERIELIVNASEDNGGSGSVVIPRFREEFQNPYSTAHDSDMTDDPGFLSTGFMSSIITWTR